MRIAVVDDSRQDLENMRTILNQYQTEHHESFEVFFYQSSIEFLERFKGGYDILFLDIEMPGSDGMETAREIR